jgi:hypothetical protein
MVDALRLRHSDSVDNFTGFSIEWDFIAGNFPGRAYPAINGERAQRHPSGSVYAHRPSADRHLAANAVTRAWIDAYARASIAVPDQQGVDTTNLVHAADIWHSIKKNWCLSARRRLNASASQ